QTRPAVQMDIRRPTTPSHLKPHHKHLRNDPLRNDIGDHHIMDEQLTHLRKFCTDHRHTIQVLPRGHDTAARYDTPFTVFDMPDPFPPVAVTYTTPRWSSGPWSS
ncbi:Scr1 family TA system antitoxin-like transcriptional regulator, partial [Polymorphospora rubra]|uniref:Scr1 family TA system antitoxin-like transcriptional regulator n=1 Tax=Polymorphospora rubra TaxID=338584 RepID=UPI0033E8B13C